MQQEQRLAVTVRLVVRLHVAQLHVAHGLASVVVERVVASFDPRRGEDSSPSPLDFKCT
jgi:hypothetical protein